LPPLHVTYPLGIFSRRYPHLICSVNPTLPQAPRAFHPSTTLANPRQQPRVLDSAVIRRTD
ncbi:hypothetical protein L873DRAFT_1805109, partial [Choiromyces venosus 120613-1]